MIQVAAALLFPEDVSKAIDELRLRFGTPVVRAVVPHITLIYPFTPKTSIDVMHEGLEPVGQRHAPFTVLLNGFRYFEGENTVAYLAVEDAGPILTLHRSVADALSDIAEGRLAHFENEHFVPHVTIHDGVPKERLPSLKAELNAVDFRREARMDSFALFANDGTGWCIVGMVHLTGE